MSEFNKYEEFTKKLIKLTKYGVLNWEINTSNILYTHLEGKSITIFHDKKYKLVISGERHGNEEMNNKHDKVIMEGLVSLQNLRSLYEAAYDSANKIDDFINKVLSINENEYKR